MIIALEFVPIEDLEKVIDLLAHKLRDCFVNQMVQRNNIYEEKIKEKTTVHHNFV